jgi:hypothetical protein
MQWRTRGYEVHEGIYYVFAHPWVFVIPCKSGNGVGSDET